MNSKKFSRYLRQILLFWDLILLNISYAVSFIFRYGDISLIFTQERKTIWLISNILWATYIVYFRAFKLIRVERIEKLLASLFKVLFLHLVSVTLLIVILKYVEISRLRIFYFYLLFSCLLILFRIIFIKVIKWLRANGFNAAKVIIIGKNENSINLSNILTSDLTNGFQFLGFFDDTNEDKTNVLGKFKDIQKYLFENEVKEMYISLNIAQTELIHDFILLAEKHVIRIKFVPNFYDYTKARKVTIDFYGNIPVLMLRKEPLQVAFNRIAKRSFDLISSIIVVLFVFSWLFPILALLVKLNSKGPVFYKQIRSGEDNDPFVCLKFRSMRHDSGEFIQATKNDPRVTRVGKIMRKSNMDELPQVFNVLLGQMSIIGPRPHPLKLDEQYHQMVEKYLVRHFAKPGISGWAQVNGCRGETKQLEDMQKRVDLDIWYIENWSFLLDLKIIWRTIANMIRGEKNAY